MVAINIPTLKSKNYDLKITMYVGTNGFKRSEILRANKWAPNQLFYVDNECITVEFSGGGEVVTMSLEPKIDRLENVFTNVRYQRASQKF